MGKTLKVDIDFNNQAATNYTAFQMDIKIPQGFTYEEYSLTPSLRIIGHHFSAAMQSDGFLRVTAISTNNAEITGRNGLLFSFTMVADANTKKGNYHTEVTKIVFSKRDGSEKTMPRVRKGFQFTPFDELTLHYVIYMKDGLEYKRVAVKAGEPIPPVDEPIKEGHTFSGWSNIPETMPNKDLFIYGKFQVNAYTISYYLNDVFYGKQEVNYGDTIVPLEVKNNDKEIFLGWEGLPDTMPAKDLTIYGKTENTGIVPLTEDTKVDVYNLEGKKLLHDVTLKKAKTRLPKGVYIVNGHIMYIR